MRPEVMAGPMLRARRPPNASVVKGDRGVVSVGARVAPAVLASAGFAACLVGAATAGFGEGATTGFAEAAARCAKRLKGATMRTVRKEAMNWRVI